jgi:hypothetical protein
VLRWTPKRNAQSDHRRYQGGGPVYGRAAVERFALIAGLAVDVRAADPGAPRTKRSLVLRGNCWIVVLTEHRLGSVGRLHIFRPRLSIEPGCPFRIARASIEHHF